MRRARLAGVLTLAGVAGAIGVTAVLAHDSSHRPRQMFLSAHGLMVRWTLAIV